MTSPAFFIPPSLPTLRDRPPSGPEWSHELKWDGYRIQLHKDGRNVVLYSRRGFDLTRRCPSLVAAVGSLPCRACVLDGELVAVDTDGRPSFDLLHLRRTAALSVVVFDLLSLNTRDRRHQPLTTRQALAQRLLPPSPLLAMSATFDDPLALLEACQHLRLEGIVSKRRDAPYCSGNVMTWVKVKTDAWRADHRERYLKFRRA